MPVVENAPARLRRRPQARGVVTRQRLLTSAEELFTRRGYDGTAIGDVAARAGVSIGTLYHHFGDKRALLLALVDAWGERIARRGGLDPARFLGDDPRTALDGWLRRSYERLRKRPSIYLVVLALADRDPEVRARWAAIQTAGLERLRALVVHGQERGLMRADLDPEATAFLIHHAIDMAAMQLLVLPAPPVAPERVLAALCQMIARTLFEESRA